ncbi:group II truncated hemoglobin [soil metagenome]
MGEETVPTLYEWIGGAPALEKLIRRFYERVDADEVLAPIFANMTKDHAAHVAAFIGEVFGGPTTYSEELGSHPHMIRKHLGRALDESKRKRWVDLLLDTANEIGAPDDPEFRSAFVAYLEWGSRLAVQNSQPGAVAVEDAPMPKWGWGEVKGPYRPA